MIEWRQSDRLKAEYIKVSYLYLLGRNTFNYGYLNYSFFRNLIRFSTGATEPYLIRYIFQSLLNQKIFTMKKKGKITTYLFNPYSKKYIREIKLNFD